MKGILTAFRKGILDVLFPPRCHVCHTFIDGAGDLHICRPCSEKLTAVTSPICPLCGIPFKGAGEDHRCGSCLRKPPGFDAARAALIYEGAGRDLIHSFKYRYRTHLRRPLALLILKHLAPSPCGHIPDLIAPVPLHVSRLRSRGFNQALLLAEILAGDWHLPLERHLLKRIRPTRPQSELTAEERRTNVRGAFLVNRPERVIGKNVLLVDDVLTTGSTVEECSLMLKKAGAGAVTVVTVARAVVS